MPDFTMCVSTTCSKKNECYRRTARPSSAQSFADFSVECTEANGYSFKKDMPAQLSFMERRAERHALIAENRRQGRRASARRW